MKILVGAGDAGGARAVEPVIEYLRSAQTARVDCGAYRAAYRLWSDAGLNPLQMAGFDPRSYDRILVGTSVSSEQLELELIRKASRCGVRTLSVIDFWSNYRERFTDSEGQCVLPDAIAVLDSQSPKAMVREGFPSDRLHVTGNPAFDDLVRFQISGARELSRKRIRSITRCASNSVCLLFVSQPLSELYPKGELGFQEEEVLRDVVNQLDRIFSERTLNGVLLLKPHPREAEYYSLPPLSPTSHLKVKVLRNPDIGSREATLGCDLVVGMNSMVLMEACLLGRPVVSYQPGLKVPDLLPSNALGWSRAIYCRDSLHDALVAELESSQTPGTPRQTLPGSPPLGTSTLNVANLLLHN